MEPNSTQSQEMILLTQEIMTLIEVDMVGKDEYYYAFFNAVLEKLNKPHDLEFLAKNIIPVFGGMGTFNDLILHKNQTTPLIEENKKLSKLKTKLFVLCKQILDGGNLNNQSTES